MPDYKMHAHFVRSTREHAKSRGVWGHAPPEKFENLHPQIESESILMIYTYHPTFNHISMYMTSYSATLHT